MRAGDVIPQVVAPLIAASARAGAGAAEAAEEVPALRHADGQARGLGLHDLPEPRGCPGQPSARQALRPRGDGHRGPGREEARRFLEEGLIADAADIYDLTRRAARRARGLRRDLGREPDRRRSRRSQASGRSRASSSRSASRASASSTRGARRALRLDRRAAGGRRRRRSSEVEGSARSWPSRSSRSSPTSGCAS